MRVCRLRVFAALAVAALALTPASLADEFWEVRGGDATLTLDLARLAALGIAVSPATPSGDDTAFSHESVQSIDFTIDPTSTLTFATIHGIPRQILSGEILHDTSIVVSYGHAHHSVAGFPIGATAQAAGIELVVDDGTAPNLGAQLELTGAKVGFDRALDALFIECGQVTIAPALADALGDPSLTGEVIGSLSVHAALEWIGGDAPEKGPVASDGARTTCGGSGPDVIVGDLDNVCNYSSVSGIEAFAVGTVSCNIGDENLLWIADTNEHPVIGQNMYRLKQLADGSSRFEQVGQSWLKHGFTALTQNLCGCGCNGVGGTRLGVGCSDPYSCSLNGSQARLGPRSEVNPHTGDYKYPFYLKDVTGDDVFKRLQVHISDLDPAQDGGGQYFVEGHYVTPDDAAAGNQNNNASYRPVSVSGSGSAWDVAVTGSTVRERLGIRAWGDSLAGVAETDVQVPGDGLVVIASEVTDLGGGMYHYEYAVQNMNCDRAIGSFAVPVGDCGLVSNIGFHDVDYHSGEPYDGTDWSGSCVGGVVLWKTVPFSGNPNANALRWGTLYNFRFDAAIPPANTIATLGIFRPGTPTTVDAIIQGPDTGPLDCNGNGVADPNDIAGGTSKDCNGNGIPDECESLPTTPLQAREVAAGLTRPVFVDSPPEDFDRLFIVEQAGVIKILSGNTVLATPFLDISSLVESTGNEQGLLSVAFHPQYSANGHFYVDYTNLNGDTVIARYTVSANPNVADAGSALILKTIPQDFTNHNGGQLQFGPDGYLYVGMGDGGSGGDPNGNAQNLASLLGKLLRLDVDAASPYIPPSNPFVGFVGADEIWAYGLRNPWRFSFDALTGDLYIGDVGQGAWEEIDFQPAASTGGENYGWRCYEGNAEYDTAGCDDPNTMVFPIVEHDHASGVCSITGGVVYRGCLMPDLSGTYFYADYCAGWIKSFRYTPAGGVTDAQDRTTELTPVGGPITSIVSFGADADGEMYIVSLDGSVYIVEPAGGYCGDGTVDPGEECDDGNTTPGDGCYQCQLEDNDNCADATPIDIGTTAFNTTNATTDGPAHPSCEQSGDGGATYNDIWFTYTAECSGTLTVSTCGMVDYDSDLVLYDGFDCESLVLLACNDDAAGCSGFSSELSAPVFAGNTYLIRVGGFAVTDRGAGTLTLSNDGWPCGICGNGTIEGGEDCDPPGPYCSGTCQYLPCETPIFSDNFETGTGWTTENIGATSGDWQRGVPVNDASWAYDPASDADGSGKCYLTQNQAGNTDVDAGSVRLISPALDFTGGDVEISYSYYLYLTNTDGSDRLLVEIDSNDGAGPWTEIARHDTDGGTTWRSHTITQADLNAAGVTSTATMRIRFTANDADPQSIVEAGVDVFDMHIACSDCNNNGIPDIQELANGLVSDINLDVVPDECQAAGDPVDGGRMYDTWWADSALPQPATDHPLWQYRPDQTSNAATGADTWRCKECHGWDYKGVDGQYGIGSHRTGFPGVLGTTLTEGELFTLLKEPPNNGGGAGVPNGHDYGSVLSDADINDLVAFVLIGQVDDDTYIDGGAEFLGDEVIGETNFTSGVVTCITCHGADGTALNFGTPEQPEWLGTVATQNPWEFMHKARFGQPGSPMPSWLRNGGHNQGVSDIGRYIQLNFPVECTNDGHCDDGDPCTYDTCEPNGLCVHIPGSCEGACCLPGDTCEQMTETDCIAAGGTFQGELTDCGTVGCGGTDVSGIVKDAQTLAPIDGAIVSLQASTIRTTSAPDGTFSLPISSGSNLTIVGAKKTYYYGSAMVDAPAGNVEILLEPVPIADDPNYAFVTPGVCGTCHPNQESQWTNTALANTGLNAWVHDFYDGSATTGGLGGFVYTRDSVFAGSNPNSECAACHQPELWVKNGFAGALLGPGDPGYPSAGVAHGISCDVCHKISDVDVSKIDFPGIYPPAVMISRPPDGTQVQYGVLGDVSYSSIGTMQPAYQPDLSARVCGACHQDKNDLDGDHMFNDVDAGTTYAEWAASPYGDPGNLLYASCVDCHMPPSGQTTVCTLVDPGRDPNSIRSHTIEGTTPAFLDNAVDLSMQTQVAGNQLYVDVDILNSMAGHSVPTGVTIRNMVLVVQAWPQGGDPIADALPFSGSQLVHDLGGAGDPTQGYYAGLPGKLFAAVNHDASLNGPTLFTEATGILFDTRIPALATDSTSYTFDVPAGCSQIEVRARLIYRRAYRFMVDQKGWTQDGHGNPLADLAAPDFGHLMEITQTTVSALPGDIDGSGGVDLTDLGILLGNYGVGTLPEQGDLNGDGLVDLTDLGLLLGNYGATCD